MNGPLTDFAIRYATAWSSQNPASLASFYAENGSLTVNGDSPSVGRAAITANVGGHEFIYTSGNAGNGSNPQHKVANSTACDESSALIKMLSSAMTRRSRGTEGNRPAMGSGSAPSISRRGRVPITPHAAIGTT